ncbi:uncharacterized protein LOC141898610 [Tubulanus polymorphus]|uniref:uncharacterized protein LOC141898610 n=1 Tax=Tubulanus polymorphus TaxID=672921 RepID=UPI003DA40A45
MIIGGYLFLFTLSCFALTFVFGGNVACPNGWLTYKDSCYKRFTTPKPWFEARARCWAQGALAVVINNPDEWNFVQSILTNEIWWLGSHSYNLWWNSKPSPRWFWDDHSPTPVGKTYWKPGSPNETPDRNCLIKNAAAEWEGASCDNPYKYICERNRNYVYTMKPRGRTMQTLACPKDQVIKLVTWRVGPDWTLPNVNFRCPFLNMAFDRQYTRPYPIYDSAVAACDGKRACRFDFKASYGWVTCEKYSITSYLVYSCQHPVTCPQRKGKEWPDKWHNRNGMCYGSHRGKKYLTSFDIAEEKCQSYSQFGHVTAISTPEEAQWLRKEHILNGNMDRLGVRYDTKLNQWMTMYGKTAWLDVRFDSPSASSCIFVKHNVNVVWMSMNCWTESEFICKIPDLACTQAMGMEDMTIADTALSGSSTDVTHPPVYGRLNKQNSAWCGDVGTFMQIDFSDVVKVNGIQTQGYKNRFVTSFEVMSSEDSNQWETVYQKDAGKLFPGNKNGDATITLFFDNVIKARYIRVYIRSAASAGACMRIELLGCIVDGGWGTWSEWSKCSKTCGDGVSVRKRQCNNPVPRYGGKPCEGQEKQMKPCFEAHCPVDGSWSCWGGWGQCSSRCGAGTRVRQRQCDDPAPAHGGLRCHDNSTELEPCIGDCKYNVNSNATVTPADEYLGCFEALPSTQSSNSFRIVKASSLAECLRMCMTYDIYCVGASFSSRNNDCFLLKLRKENDPGYKYSFQMRQTEVYFVYMNGLMPSVGNNAKVYFNADSGMTPDECRMKCINVTSFECSGFVSRLGNCALFEIPSRYRSSSSDVLYIRRCHGQATDMWRVVNKALQNSQTAIDFSTLNLFNLPLPKELFKTAKYITKLKFSNNSQLTVPPNGFFDDLENLQELEISSDRIWGFPSRLFSSLKNLNNLTLNTRVKKISYRLISHLPLQRFRTNAKIRFDEKTPRGRDSCMSKNCYSTCGEAKYLDAIRDGDTIIIRRSFIDLNELNKYSSDSALKKIRIFSISTQLTTVINVHYDLEIVTRYFNMGKNGAFRFNYGWLNTKVLKGCTASYVKSPCGSVGIMAVYYEERNASFTLYSQDIQAPFVCDLVEHLGVPVPAPDASHLNLAIYCARKIADSDSNEHTIAVDLLEYIGAVSSKEAAKNAGYVIGDEITALSQQARQIALDWRMTTESGFHKIPPLSTKAYNQWLGMVLSMIQTYDAEMRHIEDASERDSDRLLSASMLVDKANMSMTNEEKTLQNDIIRMRVSLKSMNAMYAEYQNAQKACSAAQKTFYMFLKKEGIVSSITAAIKFVGGVAGIVTGKNLDFGKVVSHLTDVGKAVKDVTLLIYRIKKLFATSDLLMNSIGSTSISLDVDLNTIQEAAELNVKVVQWQILRNMADNYLDTPKVQAINSYERYKKALIDVTLWGEALTKETITHARTWQAVLSRRQSFKLLQAYNAKLQKVYKESTKQKKITDELLLETRLQSYKYTQMAYDVLSLYCQSNFYFYFRQCSPDVRPSIGDTLTTTAVKINTAMTKEFDRVALQCQSKPIKFHISLSDINPGDDCTENECPVSHLKKSRQLFFNVDLGHREFTGYERIRVVEMRVFLDGVNSSSNLVRVSLASPGHFEDRYRGKNYSFATTPRKTSFAYLLDTGTIKEHACMYGYAANLFAELPPFTQWKLEVPTDTNPGLDLRGVKRIEIFFLTYATNTADCDYNALGLKSFTVWDDLGNRPISPECNRSF